MAATLSLDGLMAMQPRLSLAEWTEIYAATGKSALTAAEILALTDPRVRPHDKLWIIANNVSSNANHYVVTTSTVPGNLFLPDHACWRFAIDCVTHVAGLYTVGDDRISDWLTKAQEYANHVYNPTAGLKGLYITRRYVRTNTPVGSFVDGEVIIGLTSGAQGTVVWSNSVTPDNQPCLRYTPLTTSVEFAIGETIQGLASNATATVMAVPVNDHATANVQIEFASKSNFVSGDVIVGDTSGARGVVSGSSCFAFVPYVPQSGTFVAGESIRVGSGAYCKMGQVNTNGVIAGLDARWYVMVHASLRCCARGYYDDPVKPWRNNNFSYRIRDSNPDPSIVLQAAGIGSYWGAGWGGWSEGAMMIAAGASKWAAVGATARATYAAKVGAHPWRATFSSAAREACRTVQAGIDEEAYHLSLLSYYVNTFGL